MKRPRLPVGDSIPFIKRSAHFLFNQFAKSDRVFVPRKTGSNLSIKHIARRNAVQGVQQPVIIIACVGNFDAIRILNQIQKRGKIGNRKRVNQVVPFFGSGLN